MLRQENAHRLNWTRQSNADDGKGAPQTFCVTHPFHPLHGREWEIVTLRHNWSEKRVYYHDDTGQLVAFPLAWTSLAEVDPVVVIGAGRSAFRVGDLLALANLVEGIGR